MHVHLIAAMAALAPALAAPVNPGPRDLAALPHSAPALIEAYGPASQQFGELRLPAGKGPFPVAVVIHGGCWTMGYATLTYTAPMASALTARGVATWNIEYRQGGEPGGGWPGTFQDWGAGVDHLRALARRYPLDLKRVLVVGHSAGGHGALFAASRPRLPAGSPVRGAHPLPVRAAAAIDGPGEIAPFVGRDAEVCRKPVIAPLMGGAPAERPDRYRQATPVEWAPLGLRQILVSSTVLLPGEAEAYRARAAAAGDDARVMVIATGGHFGMIAPGRPEWPGVEAALLDAIGLAR